VPRLKGTPSYRRERENEMRTLRWDWPPASAKRLTRATHYAEDLTYPPTTTRKQF